jgi:hypothetical protein
VGLDPFLEREQAFVPVGSQYTSTVLVLLFMGLASPDALLPLRCEYCIQPSMKLLRLQYFPFMNIQPDSSALVASVDRERYIRSDLVSTQNIRAGRAASQERTILKLKLGSDIIVAIVCRDPLEPLGIRTGWYPDSIAPTATIHA